MKRNRKSDPPFYGKLASLSPHETFALEGKGNSKGRKKTRPKIGGSDGYVRVKKSVFGQKCGMKVSQKTNKYLWQLAIWHTVSHKRAIEAIHGKSACLQPKKRAQLGGSELKAKGKKGARELTFCRGIVRVSTANCSQLSNKMQKGPVLKFTSLRFGVQTGAFFAFCVRCF